MELLPPRIRNPAHLNLLGDILNTKQADRAFAELVKTEVEPIKNPKAPAERREADEDLGR